MPSRRGWDPGPVRFENQRHVNGRRVVDLVRVVDGKLVLSGGVGWVRAVVERRGYEVVR